MRGTLQWVDRGEQAPRPTQRLRLGPWLVELERRMLCQQGANADRERDLEQRQRGELRRLREQPGVHENGVLGRRRGCHARDSNQRRPEQPRLVRDIPSTSTAKSSRVAAGLA